MRSFGVIKKDKSCPKPLFFVQGHEEKRKLGWVIVKSPLLAKFKSFVQAVDAVVDAVGAAPETCSEWAEQQQAGATTKNTQNKK